MLHKGLFQLGGSVLGFPRGSVRVFVSRVLDISVLPHSLCCPFNLVESFASAEKQK